MLDVNDPASVAGLADIAGEVSIVVNNAGAQMRGPPLHADVADVRGLFETNVFGALGVSQLFAPSLVAQGGL